MKRSLLIYVAAPLLLLAISTAAEAQTRFGIRAGLTDSEPMIGVEAIVPITNKIMFNPTIEFTSEILSANLDAHYDINLNDRSSFWLGAGLAAVKPDVGDEDFGLNLLGGIGTRWNRFYPYAQVRWTTAHDGFGSVAVGLRF